MSLLKSSIGKKLIMSISGLFLMVFLVVHLSANAFLLIPDRGSLFNQVAHFMGTNPVIRVVEPLLTLGFLVHIIYATVLTISNRKARGANSYASGNLAENVSFASKNMFVLGFIILAFLVLHIIQFWMKLKVTGEVDTITINGEEMHDTYKLVHASFSSLTYTIIYILANCALGYHLCHGFWSAFQTIGLNNKVWMSRLKCIATIYAVVIAVGFSIIALAQHFCPIY